MCELATAAIAVAATAAVAGSAMSGYGKARQLEAESESMEYQAKVAENNAAISEQQAKDSDFKAKDATARGQLKAHRYRMHVNRLLSKQKTTYAASGVDLSGTPSNVMKDTARMGETDALTIEQNAAMESWGYKRRAEGYRQQASNFKDQSRLLSFGAREKSRMAPVAGWGTLLTGTGQTAMMVAGSI